MLTKREIIKHVARYYGLNQEVTAGVFDGIFEQIKLAMLNGEAVQFRGFGTFEPVTRAAKVGYNVHTKQPLQIPEIKTVRFKPSNDLKEFLKGD